MVQRTMGKKRRATNGQAKKLALPEMAADAPGPIKVADPDHYIHVKKDSCGKRYFVFFH